MQVQRVEIPSGVAEKKEILDCIYGVYSRWIEHFPLACRKGCAACCTRSVVLTDLEGRVILDFINTMTRADKLLDILSRAQPGEGPVSVTTNRIAEACLKHQEIEEDGPAGWDFSPCIFLEQDACVIYAVRPFGCRSFISLEKCGRGGTAEMAPVHVAVNIVFTQIVEHLSSDGGCCSTMVNMLQALAGSGPVPGEAGFLQARPVPGFLLEGSERNVTVLLLRQLYEESGGHLIFGDLIDNFMSIE